MRPPRSLLLATLLAACSRGTPAPGPSPSASSAVPASSLAADETAAPVPPDAPLEDAGDPLEVAAERKWRLRHQRGDVVYVPTPQKVVDKMLAVAKLGKSDLLYDLGCGDGRIVVTAAKKYGVHGVGFDISPERVAEAREHVRASGVESLVTIRRADIFAVDLSPANVVTLYLLPGLNLRLIPQLQKLAPGSRIVSHDFDMGDVRPDGHWTMKGPFFGRANELFEAGLPEDPAHYEQTEHRVYLWVAPLKGMPDGSASP
jgi:SAM-dependent methyltransferase